MIFKRSSLFLPMRLTIVGLMPLLENNFLPWFEAKCINSSRNCFSVSFLAIYSSQAWIIWFARSLTVVGFLNISNCNHPVSVHLSMELHIIRTVFDKNRFLKYIWGFLRQSLYVFTGNDCLFFDVRLD